MNYEKKKKSGIRTHNLSQRAAEDLHLRPRGHWDRQIMICTKEN